MPCAKAGASPLRALVAHRSASHPSTSPVSAVGPSELTRQRSFLSHATGRTPPVSILLYQYACRSDYETLHSKHFSVSQGCRKTQESSVGVQGRRQCGQVRTTGM